MPKYFVECETCGRSWIPVSKNTKGESVVAIHWDFVNVDVCKGSGAPVVEDAAPLAVAS